MRIRILSVIHQLDGSALVTFDTAVGSANGQWASKSRRPVAGASYDAELDVDLVAELGSSVVLSSDDVGLRGSGSGTRMVARVDSVDDDGVAYLRLSEDCLIMLETVGSLSPGMVLEMVLAPTALRVTAFGWPGDS